MNQRGERICLKCIFLSISENLPQGKGEKPKFRSTILSNGWMSVPLRPRLKIRFISGGVYKLNGKNSITIHFRYSLKPETKH